MYLKYATAALAAVLPLCSAQTFSDCNPMKETCEPKKGLSTSTFSSDFHNLDGFKTTAGTVNTGPNGAEFTINKKGDAPTIDTDFYFFFGTAEVVMKAASGTGIVSSIVLESDVLDEVDWEALGGDNTQVQTNYFGKGDTTSYDRVTYVPVPGLQDAFHTYTINWNKDQIQWLVDGNVVRTLNYNDAKGGSRFPQTPMRLRLGIWAGGDPDNGQGTIEWAGGLTDYGAAPFSMYVKSVRVENQNPSDSYTYTDSSGSWQSIETTGGKPGGSSSSSSSSSSTERSTTTSSSTSAESSTETSTAEATTTEESSTSTPSGMTTSASATQTDASTTSGGGASTETGAAGGAGGSATTGGAGAGSATGTETGAGATPSLFDGAASALSSSAMGMATLVGLLTAMLQL